MLLCLLLAALLDFEPAPCAEATDRLVWRQKENSVDAQIEGWPLTRLLERVAAKTRWQVLLEPDTQYTVSAKFTGLKTSDALRRLLGGLNFMLVPAASGPTRLYIYRTSMGAATELVAAPAERTGPEGESSAIPNELIVTLKADARESIDDLAKRLGAKVVGRADELHAYRLRFQDEAATRGACEALGTEPDVSAVDANYEVTRPDRPEALGGGPLPPFTLRPKATVDANRVVVGLIDTALQTQGTVLKDFLLPAVSVAGAAEVPPNQPTHGTSMAETLLYRLSLAPDSASGTPVRILPVDVYGAGESTTTFEIARGIYAAINGGASIINLSLGGEADSRFVHEVIKSGHDQGVMFLAASGNEPVTTATYPAAYPEVTAVTATSRNGGLASYANRGDFVSAAAPGTSVIPFNDRPYVVVGTSVSTANASGVAAALMAATHKTGADLEALVRQTLAFKAPASGRP
jgi:hypothetical protein